MMLYDVPRSKRGTWVRVLEDQEGPPDSLLEYQEGPSDSLGFQADDLVLYYNVDGMYSQCKNRAGELVYLKAWTDVEVIGAETCATRN